MRTDTPAPGVPVISSDGTAAAELREQPVLTPIPAEPFTLPEFEGTVDVEPASSSSIREEVVRGETASKAVTTRVLDPETLKPVGPALRSVKRAEDVGPDMPADPAEVEKKRSMFVVIGGGLATAAILALLVTAGVVGGPLLGGSSPKQRDSETVGMAPVVDYSGDKPDHVRIQSHSDKGSGAATGYGYPTGGTADLNEMLQCKALRALYETPSLATGACGDVNLLDQLKDQLSAIERTAGTRGKSETARMCATLAFSSTLSFASAGCLRPGTGDSRPLLLFVDADSPGVKVVVDGIEQGVAPATFVLRTGAPAPEIYLEAAGKKTRWALTESCLKSEVACSFSAHLEGPSGNLIGVEASAIDLDAPPRHTP